MKISRPVVFLMSLFTLFVLGGLGLAIIAYLLHIPLTAFFLSGAPWQEQLFFGFSMGIGISLLSVFLSSFDFMEDANFMAGAIVKQLNPQWYHILFYSFCAGVGEELLFRGGIQPLIGLWPTAVIFIFLHGYLRFGSLEAVLSGFYLILISAALGFLMIYRGIYAAMAAHFIIDVIMFFFIKKEVAKEGETDYREEED
ncbi:MAG: CPBP family intramembrane glutamic endopeptidase [Chitinophagales bacterium]|nr:CPBP family intramembrane glutamic endopeptidase [Chitinophagales bacterium]